MKAATRSLHLSLWLIIALAVIPVLLLLVQDYRQQRRDAIADLEADLARMLVIARQVEGDAMQRVRLVFEIMARSDNLRRLDTQECSGIAQRLLGTFGDFNNLGAALPDGRVFCSGQPMSASVNVADRSWFRAARETGRLVSGELLMGRVSGRPGMVFGYPLGSDERAPGEGMRGVLFASLKLEWFRQLVTSLHLPAEWEAWLVSTDATLLARFPDSGGAAGEQRVDAALLSRVEHLAAQAGSLQEFAGPDGRQRVYAGMPLQLGDARLLLVIGAPQERSLSRIDQQFWLRVALLMGIALLSALASRYVVYRLVESWAARMKEAITRIASGRLDTRVAQRSGVAELGEVEQGINRMAEDLEKREAELRRLSMAVEQSPEAIVITDTRGDIVYVNEAFSRSTGYSRDEVVGRNPRLLNRGGTSPDTYRELWSTLLRGEVWRGEFNNARKDGSTFVELATIAPIRGSDGTVTHYVAVKEDITQRKQSELLLHRLAYYDPLTGLPNRALLWDRLAQAIRATERSGHHVALMLLDVDGFKLLNDTQGHEAGDRLLKELAQRMSTHLRESDTVARQGDDDFAVIVTELSRDAGEALSQAEHIARKLHGHLLVPCMLSGDGAAAYYPSLCVGVTLCQGSATTPETLLKEAEVALHRAKAEGRNRISFFSPQMQALVNARAQLEFGLREGLERRDFSLHYQAQVDAQGRTVAAEALLRWRDAGGRPISPAEFIPVAEESGLIVPIGRWVLETALQQLAAWQRQPATRGLRLAVNVSTRQFHQADFVDMVREALRRSGAQAEGLELELTESVVVGDVAEAVQRMNQLRELGIRFSLDDFGTGYSSLSYLRQLPFVQLKIDRSFVMHIGDDAGSADIVRAILAMSRSLGLEVVAEGVETEAQRDFLREHGCQLFQGYLIGRPMGIEDWEQGFVR